MTRPSIGQAKLLAEAAAALDDMDSTEDQLYEQAFDAVKQFLVAAAAAVLGQGGPPRLDEFPPDEAWAQLLDGMETQIREVFTRAYLRVLGDDEAYNVQPWITRYIATVRDRLRIWPVGAFEEIRLELHEGLAEAEAVDQLRDRVGAALSIDAYSKAYRQQLRDLDRRIEQAPDASTRAELRTQRAAVRRDAAAADKVWHWKARRIARTEAVGAVNGGVYSAALARAAATGDTVRKQWLATSDDRVRDSHAHANGQVRALHEPFLVGGHPLQHPGDPTGPPAQVINCRCTMLIHHDGQEPLPLLPIGEPPALAASPEAALTTTYHGQPGDHPMVGTGRNYTGNKGFKELRDIQAKRWAEAPLPPGFASAVGSYVRDGYAPMNASLRGGDGKLTDDILALDEGFADARAILPDGATVYRGTKDASMLSGLRPGDEFIDRGFSSTSFDGEAALDYFGKGVKIGSGKRAAKKPMQGVVLFTIKVPPGSRAIVPSAIGPSVRGEDELLLPRGTKFHIVDIVTSGTGLTRVKLEVTDTPDQKSMWATTAAAGAPDAESADGAVGPGQEDDTVDPDYAKYEWQPDDIEIAKDVQRPPTDATDDDGGITAAAPEADMTTTPGDDGALPNGWRGILAPLGQPSGDGRVIAKPAKLDVRPLPLPLLAQHALAEGHDGAVVVGLHERVWVENDEHGAPMLWGEGPLDLAEEEGRQWARRMADGYAGWVSVDLDAVTMTEQMYDTVSGKLKPLPEQPPAVDGEAAGLIEGLVPAPQVPDGHELVAVADPWRFMSSTLLSQPAFHNVKLLPLWGYDGPGTGTPDRPAAQPAGGPAMSQSTAPAFASPLPFPPKKKKAGDAVPDEETPSYVPSVGDRVLVNNPDAGGAGEVTDVDTEADPILVTVALDAGGPVTVPVDEVEPEPAAEDAAAAVSRAASVHQQADQARRALTAGGPLRPPRDWFTDPGLDAPTPLTVGQDGRVYGHLAVWGTCHTGFDGACVTPPRSSTGYSMFHTGEVETADGGVLAVGTITLGGGHPDPTIGFRAATAHYDDAGTAVAVVRAFEDDHGIVVAGVLCPEADDKKVAALRRSPLSGDWRRIGGNLELIAALAVNVPGFPVTRPSLAASVDGGRQMSLVAAGIVPRRPTSIADMVRESVLAALNDRERQKRRLTLLRERMAAPVPVPWAKTRTLLAAARIRSNTDDLLAARAAKSAGYPGREGRD